MKNAISEIMARCQGDFIAIAEELHRHPETALQEFRAAGLLSDFLEREGFRLERRLAGLDTAFRATYGSGSPAIAILAEMDALPELGHACGHNIIAAAAIGAATILRRLLAPDAARIVVLGTPGEERGIGKVDMVKSGVFDDIDFAMMVHPSSRRRVVKGFLGLARVRFTFLGKAAHAAAYPEEGINALDGVIQTFNGVNALRQQLRRDVRVHGIITEGGVAPNIIPERGSCYFYVRASDLTEVMRARERVIACAEGGATASGATLQVEADERILAPFRINHAFAALYSDQLAALGLKEDQTLPDGNMGSSDIGNVSQVVPTIHPHVPIGDGIRIHSAEFARAAGSERGRDAVLEGARAMAMTALGLVVSAEARAKISAEFLSN